MKNIYFTPGPGQLYPTVKKHLEAALREDILSISHRGEKFRKIYAETVANLRLLLHIPDEYKIFFLSSGTEAMERVVQNCVIKYSFHFVNGAFSQRFYDTAQELGKKAKAYEVQDGKGFDMEKELILEDAELICFTQNETSTGVAIPPESIYSLKIKYPSKLLAVDTVSSAPYVDLDYSMLDVVFFSVQKGFGLPSGLCAMVVSPEAFAKSKLIAQKGISIGSYHSFSSLAQYGDKNQTPETPNILEIYLLGKVCNDMVNYGIVKIRKQTKSKAKLLYDFFENRQGYKIFVKEEIFRSKTVILVYMDKVVKEFIEKLKAKGLVVATGYGKYKETQMRIANFPAHSLADMEKLIQEIKLLL